MSKEEKAIKALKEDLEKVKKDSIKWGSPAYEAYLAVGYPKIKTREHAMELIADWKKDHSSCPYEVKEEALAFLEALDAKPTAKDIYHPPTNFRGEVVAADSPDAL
jgi:hypothetical protein